MTEIYFCLQKSQGGLNMQSHVTNPSTSNSFKMQPAAPSDQVRAYIRILRQIFWMIFFLMLLNVTIFSFLPNLWLMGSVTTSKWSWTVSNGLNTSKYSHFIIDLYAYLSSYSLLNTGCLFLLARTKKVIFLCSSISFSVNEEWYLPCFRRMVKGPHINDVAQQLSLPVDKVKCVSLSAVVKY